MHENITGCYYTVRIKKNLTMQAQYKHNTFTMCMQHRCITQIKSATYAYRKCSVCVRQAQKRIASAVPSSSFFFVSTVACSETRSLRSKHAQKHRESPQTVNLGRGTCEVKSQRPKISVVNGQTAEKSRSRF